MPLHGAVLDAARVTPGTRLLDAGCGAGLLALLASLRGACVSALDASAALLAVARERLPAADVREGDLEALPFADASFDAVTAVNSIFYASEMSAAVRELGRVARPGGRLVVTAWGPPERCEPPRGRAVARRAADAAPAAGREARTPGRAVRAG
ncbi:MAG: class I SAM-dependent methyltransferase [Thermodesulfobacteriota bacterium]